MALKLDIIANLKQFIAEMKKGGASVDDISDTLDDMADAGDDAIDDLENKFSDLVKAAKDAGKKVDDGVGDGFDKMKKKAGSALDDVKQEANDSARETAASFDGSADSIVGMFQETAANLGPAGLAGAALIGAAFATFTSMQEDSAALKEAVASNFDEMVSDGIAAWKSLESENARLSDAYQNHGDEIQRIADLVGLNRDVVADAWAGNAEAIGVVDAAYGDMQDKLAKNPAITREAAQATFDGWDKVMSPLTNVIEGYEQAENKYREYSDHVAKKQTENNEKLGETAKKLRGLTEQPFNAYVNVKVSDQTKAAVDRIVRDINGKVAAINVSAGINGRKAV